MYPHEYFRLIAQHMRLHEHLAEKCQRGSQEREQHEDLAQQYRDELLGNNRRRAPRPAVKVENPTEEKK
jgi:hypothetical protein